MAKRHRRGFSRRERQIMDIIYERGEASAMEVLDGLPDPPSYSAIRALLRILENKGHVKHKKRGIKYIYSPVRSKKQTAQLTVKQVLKTFFDGSVEGMVAAVLDSCGKLSKSDLDRLAKLIGQARTKAR